MSKSDSTLRVGILGAGHICQFHIAAIKSSSTSKLVAISDIDSERATTVATKERIPKAYSSLEELLAEDLDVVHVLTPPRMHAEQTIAALQANCHVFVEKPLATCREDVRSIVEAATRQSRLVCVGHSLLRDPFVVAAMRYVEAGAIGTVVGVDHIRSQEYPPYSGGPIPDRMQDGGFPFRDVGIHSLYLIEALLGTIHGVQTMIRPPEGDANPRLKDWRVLVDCEKGQGHIFLSWTLRPLQNLLLIHGTRGTIRADIFGMTVTTRASGPLPGHAERIINSMGEGFSAFSQVPLNVLRVLTKKLKQYHGLQQLVSEFHSAIREGGKSPIPPEEAEGPVRWAEEVAREGDSTAAAFTAMFPRRGAATTLLTGATGLIGEALLDKLLDSNERVRILVRRKPASRIMASDRVEIFLGDLGDPISVSHAMAGIDEVIHLGAAVSGWQEEFQCATIAGIQHMLDAACEQQVSRFIHMSSLSVLHLASSRPSDAIREDWPYEPRAEERGLYTQTKLLAEQAVLDAVRTRGLPAILLRPGEVVPSDRPFLSGAAAVDIGKALVVFGRGHHPIPVVWLDDLIDAILAARHAKSWQGDIFNLVDPDPVSQNDIARSYLRQVRRSVPVVHLPMAFVKLSSYCLTQALRSLGRSSPLTPYRIDSAVGPRSFDCTAAATLLQWTPRVGVRNGLRQLESLQHRTKA